MVSASSPSWKCPCDEAILDAVENADVVGLVLQAASQKDADKPNWIADAANPRLFSRSGDGRILEPQEKRAFKRIAGRELIRMGYEKSLDWA